jgi:hypothetical protein
LLNIATQRAIWEWEEMGQDGKSPKTIGFELALEPAGSAL